MQTQRLVLLPELLVHLTAERMWGARQRRLGLELRIHKVAPLAVFMIAMLHPGLPPKVGLRRVPPEHPWW
jgi:hypothetical protein